MKVYKEDLSNELILETWLASNKMVGLVVARRWEKRNRTNFCWQSWCMIKWGGRGKNDFSVFQSSISFGGIRTLWDKKLCMKTRYNPKTFVNFVDFLASIFGPKMSQYPQNHILPLHITWAAFCPWECA